MKHKVPIRLFKMTRFSVPVRLLQLDERPPEKQFKEGSPTLVGYVESVRTSALHYSPAAVGQGPCAGVG